MFTFKRIAYGKYTMDFKLSIPEFNGDGLIPSGDYLPTQSEFENHFVSNELRKDLYENFKRYLSDLSKAGLEDGANIMCNGSFTTIKSDPSDIDMTVDVFLDSYTKEDVAKNKNIIALLQGPNMKGKYKCDSYPVFILPIDDPNYISVTEKSIEYWCKWFSKDRKERPKGRIWLESGGLR